MDRRTYSDADLAAAVAGSRSWRGVLRALGLSATSSAAIRSVKQHAGRLGLDLGHFTGQRRWTETELAAAVAGSHSWTQVATRLGLSGGSSTAALKGHARRLGIDAEHFARATAATPTGHPRLVMDLTCLPRAGSLMAAAWFALCRYNVSWPLEPCRYDLLVSQGSAVPLRVQVKTTRVRAAGSWQAFLSTTGGRRLTYDPDEIDYFFVIDGELDYYLIPLGAVGGMHTITLSSYHQFLVHRGATPAPTTAGPVGSHPRHSPQRTAPESGDS